MGTVYRRTFTKPLPAGADIIVRKGQRLAKWKDGKDRARTEPVTVGQDGQDRLIVTAGTFTAKYRNGKGHVVEVATGCRDETAARAVLTELEKRADKVRSNLRTAAEDAVVDHQGAALAGHVRAFLEHQTAKGITRLQIHNTRRRLERVADECQFRRLADLAAAALERWLVARQAENMGAVTRNGYREAWVTFGNWCVRNDRLLSNPFASVPKADEQADPRRKRRSLDEGELVRLLDVARRRPLLDTMTVRRGKHKGERVAVLRDETRQRLELLGRERALIYKTLILTRLRKGELASLTVGQLDLDSDPAYLTLDAADEKNREGNSIPLRSDLVADLRRWLADKAAGLKDVASDAQTIQFDPEAVRRAGRARSDSRGPYGLPADTLVFDVPAGLVRILDRDLRAAGIPKRDERGRTVDVHAMRTTFGTLLSKAGTAPRTTMAAMRHSDIGLTMGVYTDPKLLDVAGAVELLPALSLTAGESANESAAKATGTDGSLPSEGAWKFAPGFAPTTDKPATPGSIPVSLAGRGDEGERFAPVVEIAGKPNEKGRLLGKSKRPSKSGREDSNLRPFGPEPNALARLRYAPFRNRRPAYLTDRTVPVNGGPVVRQHIFRREGLGAAFFGMAFALGVE
jgi:integrase